MVDKVCESNTAYPYAIALRPHKTRTLPGQHSARSCRRCAPRFRRGLPAACADALAPRRLRVPDLTPSKSKRARSGTLQHCSVSEKQQGKGDLKITGGKPGTPRAPQAARFQVSPQTPFPASPEMRRVPAAPMTEEGCKDHGSGPADDHGSGKHDGPHGVHDRGRLQALRTRPLRRPRKQ
jgi:hypothetical protein